jgi:hypothetical protein
MDWLTGIAIACVAVVALIRALAPTVGSGMQAHIAALGQLFGGWRPLPWPRGVQEDDPEIAWATHRPAAAGARSSAGPAADSSPGEPAPGASIEYLD